MMGAARPLLVASSAALARLTPRVAHGEASDESADVTGIVPVVQMQDGLIAIIERGLLDALESQNLRVKVIVFLGTANAEGQMMVTVDMCIHTHGQSSGSVKRIRRSGLRAR